MAAVSDLQMGKFPLPAIRDLEELEVVLISNHRMVSQNNLLSTGCVS